MTRPDWTYDIERTTYTDEVFSIIGRLIYKATLFESYCRSLSTLITVKSNPSIMKDEEAFEIFLASLEKTKLFEHIKNLKSNLFSNYNLNDIKGYLTIARKSRNAIAHETTLGLEHIFENSSKEDELEKEIEKLTNDIVRGEYYIILFSSAYNKEQLPGLNYIEKNINWVLGKHSNRPQSISNNQL